MRIIKARVSNYRSVIDSGYFDIEKEKTILVGPNEAGKTAILQALQKLNPPQDVPKFEALRDYPRSKYNDITTGKVIPENIIVVEGHFELDNDDKDLLPDGYKDVTYVFKRKMDNSASHEFLNEPAMPTFGAIKKDILRIISHIDDRIAKGLPAPTKQPSELLLEFTKDLKDSSLIYKTQAEIINKLMEQLLPLIDENNEEEDKRYDTIMQTISAWEKRDESFKICNSRLPVLILFSNFFRVKPMIHLEHLANRIEQKLLDDEYYDYGNLCLLKLLGFSARDLSNLGKAQTPQANDHAQLKNYRDQLDNRSYQLNAASVRLTQEIKKVWNPNPDKVEASKLKVTADGQYLKVVVEDDLGVDIELDQRSEGFQWLVSFFVVFFAEAIDKHKNAILLLDEPGLSLHGLKQREFRLTISRLAEKNQTLFTTHSPFLVGPDELHLVRVVEMTAREIGTKVHTTIMAGDSAALLPLQEALGYDLAQSLFMQTKNLILEGLTDYWYIMTLTELAKNAGKCGIDEKIALVPASSASKVIYFATILHAHELKVAALLDSDNAGDQAAKQDTLVNALGNKGIIRTKDIYKGQVQKSEIEDILRSTLIKIAKVQLGWDIENIATKQPQRPIVELFTSEIEGFSKYKLAKAFIKWSETNDFDKLEPEEIECVVALNERINKALK